LRYLDTGTNKQIFQRSDWGTHQFGSSDWDYGEQYASREAAPSSAGAMELGVTPVHSGGDLRPGRRTALSPHRARGSPPGRTWPWCPVRAQRADPRRVPRRAGRLRLPGHQFYPTFPPGTVTSGASGGQRGTGSVKPGASTLYQVPKPRRFTPATGTMRSIRCACSGPGFVARSG